MTINESIRKLIKSWLEEGLDAPRICDLLKSQASKATIYRWIDRICKSGISAKTSSGRPRSVRTKSFIAKVKRNVISNKKRKSARKIAREAGCSDRTVRLTIHDDLSLKAYKKIRVPALTDDQIKKRLSFAHWIRNHFNRFSCKTILFSDEKIFNQDGQYNHQNDRVYAESREAANQSIGLRPVHKYPYKVMVWYGLSYKGPTKIVVLPEKTRFNSDFYTENVLPIVKAEGIRLIGNKFTFQQDGATSHTSALTIDTIKSMGVEIIGPEKWPPNSPDLNPLDYFFWNEVEDRLKSKTFKNKQELIEKIKESVAEIPLKKIQDAIDSFRSRIYALEKNKGGLILNKHF
jgi:hypothetical protein